VVVDRKGRTLCIYNDAICGKFLLAKTRKRENMQAATSLSSENNSSIGAFERPTEGDIVIHEFTQMIHFE
jgi:hypothetical protein